MEGQVFLFVQSNELYESLGCYFLMTTSLVPQPIWDLVNVVKRCPQSSCVLVSFILERFSAKSSCLSSVFWEQTQDFSLMEARLPRQAFEGVSLTLTLVITISIIHPLQVQQSFAHVRRELP